MANRKTPQTQRPTKPTPSAPTEHTNVYAILGKLSDAISVVATAANALQGAEERSGSVNAEEINDEIINLIHGVACLRTEASAFAKALEQTFSKRPRSSSPSG
jgi:hypothetical protein